MITALFVVCGCCGVGVLCENCIVDASIFLLCRILAHAFVCLGCGVVKDFLFCKFARLFLCFVYLSMRRLVVVCVCVCWIIVWLFRAYGGCLGMLSR